MRSGLEREFRLVEDSAIMCSDLTMDFGQSTGQPNCGVGVDSNKMADKETLLD